MTLDVVDGFGCLKVVDFRRNLVGQHRIQSREERNCSRGLVGFGVRVVRERSSMEREVGACCIVVVGGGYWEVEHWSVVGCASVVACQRAGYILKAKDKDRTLSGSANLSRSVSKAGWNRWGCLKRDLTQAMNLG